MTVLSLFLKMWLAFRGTMDISTDFVDALLFYEMLTGYAGLVQQVKYRLTLSSQRVDHRAQCHHDGFLHLSSLLKRAILCVVRPWGFLSITYW